MVKGNNGTFPLYMKNCHVQPAHYESAVFLWQKQRRETRRVYKFQPLAGNNEAIR